MRKILQLLTLLFFVTSLAQNAPITFEPDEFGNTWTWTVFENDDNPPLEVVENPDPSGINTSATVAKFTARALGQPFAGVESQHGSDIGTFSFDASNTIIKIMVWKTVISDVGIKFVDAASAAQEEIKVPNTLINQWEELTFDFSSRIGAFPIVKDQIVIFPDFGERTTDSIIYFDSISFSSSVLGVSDIENTSVVVYPNPSSTHWKFHSKQIIEKISIYNISGQIISVFNPNINEVIVDIDNYSTGMYFAKISSTLGEKTIKLIKK